MLPQLQVWLHVACCPAATEQYVVVSAALPTPRWFKHSLACSWCPPPHLYAHPLCVRVVARFAKRADAANSEAGGRLESTAVNAGQSAAGLNIASRGGVSAQRTWFSQLSVSSTFHRSPLMANAGSRAGILALPSASCKLTGNPYRMTGRWASLPRSASQRSPGLHHQSTSMCQRVGWPVIQAQALVPRHVRRLNTTPQHAHCFLASRPLRMSHSLHVFVAGSQSMQPSMAHCTGRGGGGGVALGP